MDASWCDLESPRAAERASGELKASEVPLEVTLNFSPEMERKRTEDQAVERSAHVILRLTY